MAQRLLSISLGSEIVKICEVALAGKKKVQIFNAVELIIPEGLCEDGVILDAPSLANIILEGMRGEDFKAKKIVFSITSKRIANKEAVIPYCKENRINDIIRINASEYFPIANVEDYVFNYSILEIAQSDANKNYRLSVVATPKDLLKNYYELASRMGMTVQSIDYSGNSILQILKLQISSNEVDAILQMGSENTVINIMSGPVLVMQRSVPYGRTSIVEAVKNARGVPENVADAMVTQEYIGKLVEESEEIADAVRMLISSINRIVEFYSTRNVEKPIEHIYMLGEFMTVNGLVNLFNMEWDHEVALIEALNGVEVKNYNKLNDQIASNYLANIGALLASMNIVLAEDKTGSKTSSGKMPWWILIFAFVVSVIMCSVIYYLYKDRTKENELLQRQIDAYSLSEDLGAQYAEAQAELAAMQNWYESTKSPNESLARLVKDLEKVQPTGVAITKMTVSDGTLIIEGSAADKKQIAEFVVQLKKLEYLDNIRTDYITESFEDLFVKDVFAIKMTIKYTDPYAKDEADDESASKGKGKNKSKNNKNENSDSKDRVRVVDDASNSEDSEGGNN